MSKKLMLIDGHSILNRAFYGLPDLTNSEGIHTGAVFGFINIMLKIASEEKPDYLAVAFDVHAPTFRHEMYKEYKGTRKPMPDELREQVPLMKQMLKSMGITTVEQAGLEADDILGTLAKKAEAAGLSVALVSGDRDLLQIASDNIKIRIPKTKRGGTEIEDYYAKDVERVYRLTPERFIELKALMGDTSDNVPGIPKVGEKTATELMLQFGSIEGIYEHVDEIKKNYVRESIKANRELADLSLKLVTIKTDCDLPVSFEDAVFGDIYTAEAYELCKRLEFKALLKNFDPDTGKVEKVYDHVYVKSSKEAQMLSQRAVKAKEVAVCVYPLLDEGYVLAMDISDGCAYILTEDVTDISAFLRDIYSAGTGITVFDIRKLYSALFGRVSENRITAKASEEQFTFEDYLGEETKSEEVTDFGMDMTSVQAAEKLFDVKIAAYLINPLKSDWSLEDASKLYLNTLIASFEQSFAKASVDDAIKDKEAFGRHAAAEVMQLLSLKDVLMKQLADQGMYKLYKDTEMPLSYVLYRMEQEGIQADAAALKEYGAELSGRINELEQKIYAAAGEEFNINSPKQLAVILFEKMGIQGGKKTKTGYSTSADVLEKLAEDVPFVRDILEYRTYAKLKSTYADSLAEYIAGDGRIHTRFNQTITATGRLSSTDPNLQNIPMRTELGRRIRKVFTPKKDCVFADADYSQIELRILAGLAGDKDLIEAYREGKDIHRITASKVFGVPFEEVTDLQRRNAKAVNFGIVYGISSFGLSQDLSISRQEAKEYIDQYFATYPGIKKYLDGVKESAKALGYSVTYFGRRRPIPELNNSNFMQRQFGERVAMNAPIQGTAADIMKIAMIHVYDRLIKEGLKSKMLLQIHDEILIETYKDEEEKVLSLMREEMRAAADLPVELEVDAHTGTDWYQAK